MKLKHVFLPHSFHHKKAPVVSEVGFIAYTILLLVLGGGLYFVKTTKPTVLSFATNVNVADVVKYTNEERVKNGDSPVAYNAELSKAAEKKAQDMFAKNYWAHFGPNGEKPWDFIQSAGYTYTAAGENLARDFDDSRSVVTAWMESPSHRENLLNKSYQDIGVAVVNGQLLGHDTTLVVQMFGKPYRSSAQLVTQDAAQTRSQAPRETVPPNLQVASATRPSATPIVTAAPVETTAPVITVAPIAQVNAPVSSIYPSPQPTTMVAGIATINPFTLFKQLSIILLVFVSGFLVVDSVIIRKRGVVRPASHSLAHVFVLTAVVVAILLVKSGRII